MTVERVVLERISPPRHEREEIERKVRALLAITTKEAAKAEPTLQVILVGSVAKDTYLREPDLDVFIQFPEDVPRDRLQTLGLMIGKKVLSEVEERYAEHPYIHGSWEGMEVDMVPCYRIKDPGHLRSAVDRTPFHTAYVKRRLREEQKGQVRLLKQFAKGVGVYGAEARTQGLSGYLLELLVIRYGTFLETLKAASGWKRGTAIQLEEGNAKRFTEPLVFRDPVDANRNVASALSGHSLALFIHAARSYLQAPSERFFFPAPREPLEIKNMERMVRERGTGILMVRLDRPPIIDDNLYPQVRRTMDGLCSLLSSHDFKVVDRSFYVNEDVHFILELETLTLPLGQRHTGPPAWVDNSLAFLERWQREGLSAPYLENGHWAVIAPRVHTQADDLVRAKLGTAALGSDMRELRGLTVWSGAQVFAPEHRSPLSALLDKRLSWEI